MEATLTAESILVKAAVYEDQNILEADEKCRWANTAQASTHSSRGIS